MFVILATDCDVFAYWHRHYDGEMTMSVAIEKLPDVIKDSFFFYGLILYLFRLTDENVLCLHKLNFM